MFVLGLMVAACGGGPTPEIDPDVEPDSTAVAPACDEIDELVAAVPDDHEPTGTPPEPVDVDQQLQQWGEQEAADSFAGGWVDQDLGGYAVAFTEDVHDHAEQVRERFHPGIAVAEADNTFADLRDTQERITQEQGVVDGAPDDVRGVGAQVMINRTTVTLFDPDEQRLAELSETYGATTICFEIEQPPEPVAQGVEPLAKASDWRDGLETDAFAVIEIADHREAAQLAWQDNVPDDLEPRDDELPAEPGLYGDLDDVDFDQQAIVVWSSGESGSCPGWLADIDTRDEVVHVERDATEQTCTDDYNPYRMVLAVDRDRLPQADDLPHERIEGIPDGEIRSYAEDDEPGESTRSEPGTQAAVGDVEVTVPEEIDLTTGGDTLPCHLDAQVAVLDALRPQPTPDCPAASPSGTLIALVPAARVAPAFRPGEGDADGSAKVDEVELLGAAGTRELWTDADGFEAQSWWFPDLDLHLEIRGAELTPRLVDDVLASATRR